MMPWLTKEFGNPASRNHVFGWEANAVVEESREKIAAATGVSPDGVIFTSGATEAINLAIKGLACATGSGHLVTTAVEHPAVLDTFRALGNEGFQITVLPVDSYGRVDPQAVSCALRDDTILVSVILANNEIGTVNDLKSIGRVCGERGIALHSDTTQAFGKIPVDIEELGIDLFCLSAHKFYGPKGIGACLIRKRTPKIKLEPLIHGGGHEKGLRAGTLNVPGIVGMAEALELAEGLRESESQRLTGLRDRLRKGLFDRIDHTSLNGDPDDRLPGNLNLSFEYAEGEALLMSLTDIALSSGSACTTAKLEPSHVLRAIGLSDELVHSSIRFGLGRNTTEDEIDYIIERVTEEVERLRELSPHYEALQRSKETGYNRDVTKTVVQS